MELNIASFLNQPLQITQNIEQEIKEEKKNDMIKEKGEVTKNDTIKDYEK